MKGEAKPVTAKVTVPASETDASIVTFEEIPLPPREMWGDVEDEAIDPAPIVPAAPVVDEPAPEVTVLDFVGSTHERRVPLKHHFRYNGQVVDSITVKRLTLGEVDTFVRRAASTSFSTFDIYAVMTGFPAPVLRGLVDEDGDAVTDAAYDFLPRALKAENASTET